jgi:DNA ligase-1
MAPEKAAHLFGIKVPAPPAAKEREALLERFFEAEIGLDPGQKLCCVLGDPFRGRPATLRRNSLVQVLESLVLASRRELLNRLTRAGNVAVLFAECRAARQSDPALTAAEVLEALAVIPELRRNAKLELLRDLLRRMGKLEAFFLAKLVLRKAGFGFDYQGSFVARVLGARFGVAAEQVSHAMALTDAFNVLEVLERDGPDGLRAIRLQPLVPVRPALASGSSTRELKHFPVWVERKYDGIRLLLHKSTDARGSVLCGAYTRSRGDWIEAIPGIEMTARQVPALSAIVDGELYGTMVTPRGVRPATVYEVYGTIQGDPGRVSLRYAAFDLLYLNGQDLTQLPLSQRRERLRALLGPLQGAALPIPVVVAEGQLAQHQADVNRLYHHFRTQGHEGIIAKDLNGPYLLASRDPSWLKRKPEITLDLVLLGAVLAVTSKENVGLFGSYVIGARTPEGSYEDVGDVAGLDRQRDAQIQQEIMREGLLTGQRIERQSSSGTRPGFELKPHIVCTVKFEGIVREATTGKLFLRSPKVVAIRSDKGALEADSTKAIEEISLRQRMG